MMLSSEYAKGESQSVIQSKFFAREFNTAIIDGPLRIYFSDRQESEALQIYFEIQESLTELGQRLDSLPLRQGPLFLMVYPTLQLFEEAFVSKQIHEENDDCIGTCSFGEGIVLGVTGPCTMDTKKSVSQKVLAALRGPALSV
jgi:hypothetical protein